MSDTPMKHKNDCALLGFTGGQGLEFIPCNCGADTPERLTPERLQEIRESADYDSAEDIGRIVGRRGIIELITELATLLRERDEARDEVKAALGR